MVLYFFYEDGTETSIVATLINQLVMSKKDTIRIRQILRDGLYKDGSDKCKNLDFLWKILIKMLMGFPSKVHVLIDAMDECLFDERQDIFKRLPALVETGACIFITSRPEYDIKLTIASSGFTHYHINDHLKNVIRIYVKDEIKKMGNRRPVLEQYINEILETIENRADGMFRYAELLLKELDEPNPEDILDTLKTMPEGIFGMYDRIIARKGQTKTMRRIRKRALVLIAVAAMEKYWLCIEDIQLKCAVVDGEIKFDPAKRRVPTVEYILKACAPLIDFEHYPRFTHLSVKD